MRTVFLLRLERLIVLLGMLGFVTWQPAAAQDLALASRAPRFLMAAKPAPVEVDAQQNALLRQVVSLTIERPTIGRLLAEI